MEITDKRIVRKVFNKVKKAIDEQDNNQYKMIYIGVSRWGNSIIEEMQTVSGLYILGFESSWKPIIVNKITLTNNNDEDTYIMNEFLTHTNINDSIETKLIYLNIDGKAHRVSLTGQQFCNPLTANHVFEQDEEETRGLIRANLMSQNFNDPYCTPKSVSNDKNDLVLKYNMTRTNNSPIEMLTGTPAYQLGNMSQSEQNELVKNLLNIDKNELYAKYKSENYYKKVTKNYYRTHKEYFSDYYPTYSYEYIQSLNLEMPKESYDIGVFGIGSAGTAILDQLCRSNWIENIYLCDPDFVEEKNLINQWYLNNNMSESKTSASAYLIKLMRRTNEKIKADYKVQTECDRFENTKYKERKFKYVVSGFDSIKTRKTLFEEIKNGNLETQYLIDCRYLDLAGSVYVIDISNKKEMDFYEQNLLADEELLKKKIEAQAMSEEEFYRWLEDKNPFSNGCASIQSKYFSDTRNIIIDGCNNCSCRSKNCKKYFYKAYLESMPNKAIHSENTCIKLNYIDIYKYVGAIIFGAIRRIENDQHKPFTLLEAQVDVNGLPNYMIVKE